MTTYKFLFLLSNKNTILRVGVVHRFRYGKPKDCGIPAIGFKFVGRKMLKEAYCQGYGRHTKDECMLYRSRNRYILD